MLAFDGRNPGAERELPIAHRRGYDLEDLAIQAHRGGAAAVVFVGFDSLALRDGASDRTAVAASSQIQAVGIAPLLEVVLEDRPGWLPTGVRYRVDELAAEFAGVGLPLVADADVVRTVPAAAVMPTLEPGAVVRGGEPARVANVVFGLALRALLTLPVGEVQSVDADELRLDDETIPLGAGRLRVHWSDRLDGREDPAVIPAERVHSGGADPQMWAGKVVLIGTTDPAYTPYYDTPQGPMPEILVHANALNTLLTQQYLHPVPDWVGVIAALLVAGVVALMWRRRWWTAALTAVLAGVGWLLAVRALAGDGWLVEPLRPTVAAAVTLAALGVAALTHQLLQRRRLAKLFSEYVPADVARDLVDSGRAETAQAGERLLVTVLFCDLRGFTPTAARLAPADVCALLDTYYERLSQIVFDHGGTVLQYTGDEIFAVFGAPVPRTTNADAALACAQDMHAARPQLNDHLRERGLPEIAFGIGLHSGLVVAAHVGSTIRRQYSIIGDPVNVGSRLCGQAREGQIVYSQALHDHLATPADVAPAGQVELKGVTAPVTIYRLRCPQDRVPATDPQ